MNEPGNLSAANISSRWRRSIALLGSIFVLCATAALLQAQDRPTEYQVKAAYLYNFGKFVTFAGDKLSGEKNFDICILGEDPFGSALDTIIAGATIDGKQITTRRIE